MSLLCAVVMLSAGITGCAGGGGAASTEAVQPTAIKTADLSGAGPGTLVSASTMPNIDRKIKVLGATSARVVYRSTSGIDGSATEVSGVVFVPIGNPPPGGWPVFAYAHGTTGINEDCGPSLSPDIFGAVDIFVQYLKLGFAVAATDYQGLGAPGGHPYLDAKTAGLNVIDAVRAARHVSNKVSNVWAVFGGSQGGGAAWAANEQATNAPDLRLLGSISLSPALDLVGLAAEAANRTLTKDQQALYIWVLSGIARTRPDFTIDDYRRGVAAAKWDVLDACIGPDTTERTQLLQNLSPDDLVPATPEAEQRLTEILQSMAVPQQKAAAPMYVVWGGKDTFINPDWTRAAIERGCALGDVIEATFQPDRGHGDVDGSGYVQWLGQRLAGTPPPPNTCPPVSAPEEVAPDDTSGADASTTPSETTDGTTDGTTDDGAAGSGG